MLTRAGHKYRTDFFLCDAAVTEELYDLFDSSHHTAPAAVLDYFVSQEMLFRAVDFYGAQVPYDCLLWNLLMMATNCLYLTPAFVQRQDWTTFPSHSGGARYLFFGLDLSEEQLTSHPRGYVLLQESRRSVGYYATHSNRWGYYMCNAMAMGEQEVLSSRTVFPYLS